MDRVAIAAQVGQIWLDELAEYPLWAIHNATRWWVSSKNDRRHKKPLPGDISERCEVEIMLVRVAQRAVERFDKYGAPKVDDEPPAVEMTDDERAAMNAETQKIIDSLGGRQAMHIPQSADQTQRNINEAIEELGE